MCQLFIGLLSRTAILCHPSSPLSFNVTVSRTLISTVNCYFMSHFFQRKKNETGLCLYYSQVLHSGLDHCYVYRFIYFCIVSIRTFDPVDLKCRLRRLGAFRRDIWSSLLCSTLAAHLLLLPAAVKSMYLFGHIFCQYLLLSVSSYQNSDFEKER